MRGKWRCIPSHKSGRLPKSHHGYFTAAARLEAGAHTTEVIAHLCSDLDVIAEAELRGTTVPEAARRIMFDHFIPRLVTTGKALPNAYYS